MTTLIVTYKGEPRSRFDREYYSKEHLPLVKRTWGPQGMRAISASFPVANQPAAGEESGIVALCLCDFNDDDALQQALSSPDTPQVMADLVNFTDLKAIQHVLRPFKPGSETA